MFLFYRILTCTIVGVFIITLPGCELIALEEKKVPYLLEINRSYSYLASLNPGESSADAARIDRSDFDIPDDADIKSVKLKNIWLGIDPLPNNGCALLDVSYSGIFEPVPLPLVYAAQIPITSSPISDFLINAELQGGIKQWRQLIENTIKTGNSIVFTVVSKCVATNANTELIIHVKIQMDIEYEVCEEVFCGSDLPDCDS